MTATGQAATEEMPSLTQHLPADMRCVGVLSGKGGVGKSLITGLLAVAFARKGHSVGILDADLTGPSIPRMFGVRRAESTVGDLISPARTRDLGIRIISLNLLMEREDDPVIWRGPLVAKTVEQFVTNVDWTGVRHLFVDLPPGTSDVPLTVMQRLPLNGLIAVYSPQELVGMIVRKAIRMAALLETPVVGLIENMAHLICPHCGEPIDLFGACENPKAAGTSGLPVLASLALDPNLSVLCDRGEIESYENNPLDDLVHLLASALEVRGTGT